MTKARVLLAVAVLAAFLAGSVFGYYRPGATNNSVPAVVPERTRVIERTPAPTYIAERRSPVVHRKRSWEREALIVGGSAGAGAAIGGLAKGKKGAAVGALTGGVAGLVYDLATRNRTR